MNITFERDSVCAGDDVRAPNSKAIQFDEPKLLSELCGGEVTQKYLPVVSGVKTEWSAIVDGSVAAKIWHSCIDDRVIEIELVVPDTVVSTQRVYFRYVGQEPHFSNS